MSEHGASFAEGKRPSGPTRTCLEVPLFVGTVLERSGGVRNEGGSEPGGTSRPALQRRMRASERRSESATSDATRLLLRNDGADAVRRRRLHSAGVHAILFRSLSLSLAAFTLDSSAPLYASLSSAYHNTTVLSFSSEQLASIVCSLNPSEWNVALGSLLLGSYSLNSGTNSKQQEHLVEDVRRSLHFFLVAWQSLDAEVILLAPVHR